MSDCKAHRDDSLDVDFLLKKQILSLTRVKLAGHYAGCLPSALICYGCHLERAALPFFVETFEMCLVDEDMFAPGIYGVALAGELGTIAILHPTATTGSSNTVVYPIYQFQLLNETELELLHGCRFMLVPDASRYASPRNIGSIGLRCDSKDFADLRAFKALKASGSSMTDNRQATTNYRLKRKHVRRSSSPQAESLASSSSHQANSGRTTKSPGDPDVIDLDTDNESVLESLSTQFPKGKHSGTKAAPSTSRQSSQHSALADSQGSLKHMRDARPRKKVSQPTAINGTSQHSVRGGEPEWQGIGYFYQDNSAMNQDQQDNNESEGQIPHLSEQEPRNTPLRAEASPAPGTGGHAVDSISVGEEQMADDKLSDAWLSDLVAREEALSRRRKDQEELEKRLQEQDKLIEAALRKRNEDLAKELAEADAKDRAMAELQATVAKKQAILARSA